MISVPTPSIIDTRREQMLPTLQPSEIERVRRFGEVRSFKVGEPLAKVGDFDALHNAAVMGAAGEPA
jgi:thioredoxin reductase (NADPH)